MSTFAVRQYMGKYDFLTYGSIDFLTFSVSLLSDLIEWGKKSKTEEIEAAGHLPPLLFSFYLACQLESPQGLLRLH